MKGSANILDTRAAPTTSEPPTRAAILWLAAAADIDIRTARKALVDGVDSLRGRVRERVEGVLRRAHPPRPSEAPPPNPRAA